MSNGRSFSRKKRTSPNKSVRKTNKKFRSSMSLQQSIDQLGRMAESTITSALTKKDDPNGRAEPVPDPDDLG
jgi:hypothetical protein